MNLIIIIYRVSVIILIPIIITLIFLFLESFFQVKLESVNKLKFLNFLVLIWFEWIGYFRFYLDYSERLNTLFLHVEEIVVTFMFFILHGYEEFTGYQPNFTDNNIQPRFVLLGLAFYNVLFILTLILFYDEVNHQFNPQCTELVIIYDAIFYILVLGRSLQQSFYYSTFGHLLLTHIILVYFLEMYAKKSNNLTIRTFVYLFATSYATIYTIVFLLSIIVGRENFYHNPFIMLWQYISTFLSVFTYIIFFIWTVTPLVKIFKQAREKTRRQSQFWKNYSCEEVRYNEHDGLADFCSICRQHFQMNQCFKQLKCGHGFHKDCLRNMLLADISYRRASFCPNCRNKSLILNPQ